MLGSVQKNFTKLWFYKNIGETFNKGIGIHQRL